MLILISDPKLNLGMDVFPKTLNIPVLIFGAKIYFVERVKINDPPDGIKDGAWIMVYQPSFAGRYPVFTVVFWVFGPVSGLLYHREQLFRYSKGKLATV